MISYSATFLTLTRVPLSRSIVSSTAMLNLSRFKCIVRNHVTRPFADIFNLSTLEDLSLGHNKLTGIFPVSSFNNHPKLTTLNLTNNLLQGPTPRFNNSKLTVDMRTGSNSFCLDDPGLACDSRVNILLSIVESMGYPEVLAESRKGNDPCPTYQYWKGISCDIGGNITGISFQNLGLSVPIQVLRPRICGISVVHSVDFGDMAIPIQVLRNATNNFSEENRLGRVGVGTVYKGELKDGTEVGVKRMELGSVTEQGIAQFESEITVLTKGTLGTHLFNWEEEGLEPLEWNTRTGKHSILTKVAGTFGYLAPEYIGRKVVDATHSDPEYIIHLATWFQKMHKNHDTFQMAIDKTIQLDEENLANVSTVAELGDHCCANEP
ncbi:Receptor protein kinase TMK1 [Citrus sinensis]|nr:Receptor protein kinase TMK1 [Citrus sinensis]